jgi:hypothetical protein
MSVKDKEATPSLRNLWPKQQYVDGGEWHAFFPQGASVIALPGWDRPRLLVPASTLASRWSGSGVYPAVRVAAKAYRWLLRFKALGGVRAVRVPEGSRGGPTLQDFLADTLPGARVRAVMMGVAHQAQKLTVQLVSADGTVVGYLKCAAKPVARQRLKNEYLLQSELPAGAGPRPLKYARLGEMEALLMEPVRGRALSAALPPPPQLAAFVFSLSTSERYPFQVHPWVQARGLLQKPELQPVLANLISREWAVVRQHGDLVPWNLIQTAEGRLTAIDWEYGCKEGFPGVDLAHYILQVAAQIHRWTPARAREYATQYLVQSGLDVSVEEARAIVKLAAYLAFQDAIVDGWKAGDPLQRWRGLVWREMSERG